MSIGLVGIKTGMTRVFDESGISIPVTVINIDTNRVSQIKTVDALMKLDLAAGVDVQIELS